MFMRVLKYIKQTIKFLTVMKMEIMILLIILL